jgi:hypothetical protein
MPPNDPPGDNIGVEMMRELIKNLVLLNRNMELNRDLMLEMRDTLQTGVEVQKSLYEAMDATAGELSVWGRAMEILDDVRDTKRHLTFTDLVVAYASADEELSDDEPGNEDPLVGAGS